VLTNYAVHSLILYASNFTHISVLDQMLIEAFLFAFRYPFTSKQVAPPLDWEQYVSEIATDILTEQSPKRFLMFFFEAEVPTVFFFAF
jgi:hypothetical protein